MRHWIESRAFYLLSVSWLVVLALILSPFFIMFTLFSVFGSKEFYIGILAASVLYTVYLF